MSCTCIYYTSPDWARRPGDPKMPPSMRRQASKRKRKRKRSKKTREAEAAGREKALFLLTLEGSCDKISRRSIASSTGISKSTVQRMSDLTNAGDELSLSQMVSVAKKPGRCTVLTYDEERMIMERIGYAAARGFAIDLPGLRYLVSRVAEDGRKGFKNGIPCEDAVRAFRARHRDITFKKADKKENAKLNAESYEHVQKFFDILTDIVEKAHPEILSSTHLLWNMDETSVDATAGVRSARVKRSSRKGAEKAMEADGAN